MSFYFSAGQIYLLSMGHLISKSHCLAMLELWKSEVFRKKLHKRSGRNLLTRWYPRGIQISVHIRSPRSRAYGGGGGVTLESKLKSLRNAKICLNFNFRGVCVCVGGGGGIGSVPRVGHSRNFEPNFQPLQLATASQIVSHILRMWRLTRKTGIQEPKHKKPLCVSLNWSIKYLVCFPFIATFCISNAKIKEHLYRKCLYSEYNRNKSILLQNFTANLKKNLPKELFAFIRKKVSQTEEIPRF